MKVYIIKFVGYEHYAEGVDEFTYEEKYNAAYFLLNANSDLFLYDELGETIACFPHGTWKSIMKG